MSVAVTDDYGIPIL